MGEVVNALAAQFSNPERPPVGGVVPQVEHRPGADVALDGLWTEDCPGIVFTNVIRIFRSNAFPAETTEPTGKGILCAAVQIGAARRVHTVDDMGYPPTAEEMETDALTGLDDARRLERAACAAAKACDERGLAIQSVWSASEPNGPQGGALAWTKLLTFQLT